MSIVADAAYMRAYRAKNHERYLEINRAAKLRWKAKQKPKILSSGKITEMSAFLTDIERNKKIIMHRSRLAIHGAWTSKADAGEEE